MRQLPSHVITPGVEGQVFTTIAGRATWAAAAAGPGGSGTPMRGVHIYRADPTALPAAAGSRFLTDTFDTTAQLDVGFAVNLAAGTVTVPSDGWYLLASSVSISGAGVQGTLAVAESATGLIKARGDTTTGNFTTWSFSGLCRLSAGSAVSPYLYTAANAQIIGAADSTRTSLVVLLAGGASEISGGTP